MSDTSLAFLPHVNTDDAVLYVDSVLVPRYLGPPSLTTFLGAMIAMPPLTLAESQRYASIISGTDETDAKALEELQERMQGYQVLEYPTFPVSGTRARQVLADYLEWCQQHHNKSSTIAFITATYDGSDWHLKVFDRVSVQTKLITRGKADKMYATLWDDLTIRGSLLTYLPNPFTASPEHIRTVRGSDDT